jgi:hypothetical protein
LRNAPIVFVRRGDAEVGEACRNVVYILQISQRQLGARERRGGEGRKTKERKPYHHQLHDGSEIKRVKYANVKASMSAKTREI